MARLARAVFPGLPHGVTQRGNGRQQTFFRDASAFSVREQFNLSPDMPFCNDRVNWVN